MKWRHTFIKERRASPRRISIKLAVLPVNCVRCNLSQILRANFHLFLYMLQNPFHWCSPMRMQQALTMTFFQLLDYQSIFSTTSLNIFSVLPR